MDTRSVQALQGYAAAKRPVQETPGDLGSTLNRAAGDFNATLAEAEATARQAMTSNADPHALVEALASTQLAVETAVTVRDRVVEAYQEILRMPV